MVRRMFTVVLGGLLAVLPACGGESDSPAVADGGGEPATADGALAPEVTGPRIDVTARDISFRPDELTVPAGAHTVVYVNEGQLEHTLLIDGVRGFKLVVRRKGQTDLGVVDLLPGRYTYYCDVPGHRAAGMEGELTVQ